MRKIIVIAISLLLGLQFNLRADEGMYLLSLLQKLNLNQKGMVLTADDIYSINHSSLKDAVVGLGSANNPYRFFCTGEIISDKGLILTNHHCGYGSIQSHSSPEHDYLADGFWAMNLDEELINEGMVVSILVRMEDVTEKVMAGLNDEMSEEDRAKNIAEISKTLVYEATANSLYGGNVKAMYEGNRFYMFIYETFKDIRLVGAPPSSVGKYGGDTDNWMWPRHTGDFSMFRIYTGADDKPATYTKENKPYTPNHHFPISLNGYQNNDFAFVMGYPGSTNRFETSYGITESLDKEFPARIEIRGKKLDVMKEHMDQSQKVRIQYASKYARVSNYWKYFIGQSAGLKKLKVYDKKLSYEQELQAWIEKDESRKAKYGDAFKLIEEAYKEKSASNFSMTYFGEALRGIEITSLPATANRSIYKLLKDDPKNTEEIAKAIENMKAAAKDFYKDYDLATDKQMTAEMLNLFIEGVDPAHYPDEIASIAKKYKGNYAKYADMLFAKSMFASEEKLNAFLENPSAKKLEKDPAYKLYLSIGKKQGELHGQLIAPQTKLDKGRRLMLAAMLDKEKGQLGYPDANSTPRYTYGYVGDYFPADGVHYKYFTTIEGIMEKEDPTNPDFTVAPKLKDLYNKKDYGQYADANGDLNICFTTNNDITGGNSGSPVLNAKGELIGAAFDGNWEAMSGDIAFETELQKCINVDIRYVLFIVDKYAGAQNLIDEMTIVKGQDRKTSDQRLMNDPNKTVIQKQKFNKGRMSDEERMKAKKMEKALMDNEAVLEEAN